MSVNLVAINDRQSSAHREKEALTREKEETTCKQLYNRALQSMGKAITAEVSGNIEESIQWDVRAMGIFTLLLERSSIRDTVLSIDGDDNDDNDDDDDRDHDDGPFGPMFGRTSTTDSSARDHHYRRLQKKVLLYLKYLSLKNMGEIYRRRQRFSDAAKCYEQAAAIDPTDTTLWYELAVAASRTDQYAKSRMALEHVLALQPEHQLALELLMEVLYVVQDYGYCAIAAQRVIDSNPQCVRARSILSECLRINPHYHLTEFGYSAQTLSLNGSESGLSEDTAVCDLQEERLRVTAHMAAERSDHLRSRVHVTVVRLEESTWHNLGRHLLLLFHHRRRMKRNLNDKIRITHIVDDIGNPPQQRDAADTTSTELQEEQQARPMEIDQDLTASEQSQEIRLSGRKRKTLSKQQRQTHPQETQHASNDERRSKRIKEQKTNPKKKVIDLIKSTFWPEDDNDENSAADMKNNVHGLLKDEEQTVEVKCLDVSSFIHFMSSIRQLEDDLGLLDAMHLFVEVLCTKYWSLLWPSQLSSQVCNMAVRLHNIGFRFTPQATITLSELFHDKSFEDSQMHRFTHTISRMLMMSVLGQKVANPEEIELEPRDILRANWLLYHIGKKARNTRSAYYCFEQAVSIFDSLSNLTALVIPNCSHDSMISKNTIEIKRREFDYISQVDLAEEQINANNHLSGIETIIDILDSIQTSTVATRVRDLLMRSLSRITVTSGQSMSRQRIVDLTIFILRGIDQDIVQNESRQLLKVFKNMYNVTSLMDHTLHVSLPRNRVKMLVSEFIRIAEMVDQGNRSAHANLVARKLILLYKLVHKCFPGPTQFKFLQSLRSILISHFRIKMEEWFFSFLINELYSLLLSSREKRPSQQTEDASEVRQTVDSDSSPLSDDGTESSSDEENELDERMITEELYTNFWIMYNIRLNPKKDHSFKNETKVEGKKAVLSANKHMSAIALDLLTPFVEKDHNLIDQKRNIKVALSQIFTGFKTLPEAIAKHRDSIQQAIGGRAYQWYGSIENAHRVVDELNAVSMSLMQSVEHLHLYQLLHFYLGWYIIAISTELDINLLESRDFAYGVSMLERACLCAPMEVRVWRELAHAYLRISEELSDMHDETDSSDALSDAQIRETLRLPKEKNFLIDFRTCRDRAIYCYGLACTIDPSDIESVSGLGRVLSMSVSFARDDVKLESSDISSVEETIAGMTRQQMLERGLQCFTKAMEKDCDNYVYPMMTARVMEMIGGAVGDQLMELYAKSARLEREKSKGKDGNPEPLLRLQGLRIECLLRSESEDLDPHTRTQILELVRRFWFDESVIEDGSFFKALEKDSYFSQTPKNPEFDASEGATSLSDDAKKLWYNVYYALLSCLRMDEYNYKVLYMVAECLTVGPWRSWKQAQSTLSILFKVRGSSRTGSKRPDVFRYDMKKDENDMNNANKLMRQWKAKITLLYSKVLSKTRDLEQLSMLAAGLRRNHIQSAPRLFDVYREVLVNYAQTLVNLDAQGMNGDEASRERMQRHVGELFTYVNDHHWDEQADMSRVRKAMTSLKDQWITPAMTCTLTSASNTESTTSSRRATSSSQAVTAVMAWCKEKFGLDYSNTKKNTSKKAIEATKSKSRQLVVQTAPDGDMLLSSSSPILLFSPQSTSSDSSTQSPNELSSPSPTAVEYTESVQPLSPPPFSPVSEQVPFADLEHSGHRRVLHTADVPVASDTVNFIQSNRGNEMDECEVISIDSRDSDSIVEESDNDEMFGAAVGDDQEDIVIEIDGSQQSVTMDFNAPPTDDDDD